MAGWHHRLDGHEFELVPRVVDGQGGLACCNSWGRKESDTTEWLNWTELTERVSCWFGWQSYSRHWHTDTNANPFMNKFDWILILASIFCLLLENGLPQMVKNLPAMLETQVWSLGWEDTLEKGMATHSSILNLENSMDRGALGGLQSMGLQRVEHYCQLFWKISYVPHKYPVGATFWGGSQSMLLQKPSCSNVELKDPAAKFKEW